MVVNKLAQRLERGPLLFDGAMGTEIYARGVAEAECLEALNVSQPALIARIHRDYIAAGADVIETNTFGANRFRLGEHYREAEVRQLCLAGARLALEARNAAGRPVLVAGSVGPLGRPIEPVGAIKRSGAERVFSEQIAALAEGGVDLLILETFTALNELELAVDAARATAPDLPVVALLSFDDELNPARAASALVESLSARGVTALGANCGAGPQSALSVARQLASLGAQRLAILPNAGLPHREAGRLVYSAGPQYFAEQMAELLELGVSVVGGCCGTGPAHIQALRRRVDGAAPGRTVSPRIRRAEPGERQVEAPSTSLAAKLRAGEFPISVELTPPRGIDPSRMLAGARLLQEAGVEFANVTDSAMARLRMGVISCAALVQQQVGLETIAHFTCRDRNVMAIQSELIGAHALGIRNIFALRGDPPRVGDYPKATPVWDVNAVGLITILSNLNRGLDANGTPIGERAFFNIGAAFNPTAEDPLKELRLLRRKLAAGAHFVLTNPVYDFAALALLRQVFQEVEVPLLIGAMPLRSAKQAAYLQNEVPGIVVPETVAKRLEAAGEEAPQIGVEMAIAFFEELAGVAAGAYVIPSGGRYDLAAQVVEGIKSHRS
ncbi:MAG: bifunctional homocysteine S-methyltransferase/methylenetetrahydrofolate reductase [Candidatus Dormiibacter spiritus]|nr:MAG: bifunctional homocysteine S-methyltransferase/methylenetetrahydrofolate reductase [Candidatus Dormibacteraeota bacterium]